MNNKGIFPAVGHGSTKSSSPDKYHTVFISNLRDEADIGLFLNGHQPVNGHFHGGDFRFHDTHAHLRMIHSLPKDIFSHRSRAEAQKQFLHAVEWSLKKNAKVILFAATTKRLFSKKEMEEVQVKYPEAIFTIGDNGTALTLLQDTSHVLRQTGLFEPKTKVLILGPSGHLGSSAAEFFVNRNFNVCVLGNDIRRIENRWWRTQVEAFNDFSEAKNIDAVIACSHDEKLILTPEVIKKIKNPKKKMVIVDVAEPKNVNQENYSLVKDDVLLAHAGDPYSENLSTFDTEITNKKLRLTEHRIFGCFAEALVLGKVMHDGYYSFDDLRNYDLLEVNPASIDLIDHLFGKYDFNMHAVRCFGQHITDYQVH